jgi:hypothetical protein
VPLSQTLPGIPEIQSYADCLVVAEPELVARRLTELQPGLDEALLREVNEYGYRARLEATPSHAPTAAGTFHWNGAVYALRSRLAERDWAPQNLRNCPFIVSPDKTVAIAVMTGDPDTGLKGGHPTNQAQKGVVLRQAVANNRHQLELFNAGVVSAALAKSKDATQLWVLLYHVAVGESGRTELRAELSLPLKFERKQIVGWRERLVLGAIRPDSETDIRDESPAAPIDVFVERRTGTT